MSIPKPVLGSDPKDLAFVKERIAESYEIYQARYPYYVLKAGQDAELNLYGERDYENDQPLNEYDEVIMVPLNVTLEPEADDLSRFGLDTEADALVTTSIKIAEEMGLFPKIGDRFDFNEWQFEIKTVKPGSFFANSKSDTEWLMTADRTHRRWPDNHS